MIKNIASKFQKRKHNLLTHWTVKNHITKKKQLDDNITILEYSQINHNSIKTVKLITVDNCRVHT